PIFHDSYLLPYLLLLLHPLLSSSYLHQHLGHHSTTATAAAPPTVAAISSPSSFSTTAAEARKPPPLRLLPPLRRNLGDGDGCEEAAVSPIPLLVQNTKKLRFTSTIPNDKSLLFNFSHNSLC
ncbi:hypothetical protein LINGRAHAP2_LOCUS24865, partial [Linum grandiflorum]